MRVSYFFFFEQKTAYEMRISDWSSDVCSSDLTDEERMIRDSARAFCDTELRPVVRAANRSESYDPDLMKKFGRAGLLGVTIDGYGCAGTSYVAYGLVAREVERVDSAYRSAMSVQSSLVMYPIHAFGADAQRDTYLPALARGELIGAFGPTEPDAGAATGPMNTRPVPTPAGQLQKRPTMRVPNPTV